MSNAYKNAGVDVTAGYEAVKLMKKHVARTVTDGVLSGIGGFGGLFRPDIAGMEEPVTVSGTDGVGTKLKIAFLTDRHNTVGQDCVAMCVNDIVCAGAAPMFFLDYLAVGKNVPEKIADIVSGVADGCVLSGCALIGGETAEMPGFYPEDEYDLAGFAVGIADRKNIIDGKSVKPGDTLIGIASSGVHSNGFSLVRSVFGLNGTDAKEKLGKHYDELGCTLGEELIKPTKIYVKPVLDLIKKVSVKAISHITGGGFIEFSELRDFIDSPIRTYSSGMYTRLAFSVAVHVSPDILLIDEILAVGDINFQKKCIAKIKEFKKKGVTMVFVSHNMNDVLEICDSVVWLDKGRMIEYGDTETIAEKYLDEMNRRGSNE